MADGNDSVTNALKPISIKVEIRLSENHLYQTCDSQKTGIQLIVRIFWSFLERAIIPARFPGKDSWL